jgi:O-antigen/teichoic acid export membrane protein
MISIAAASFIVPLLCVINSDDKGNARIFAVLAVNICAGVIFWIINMVHGRQFYAKPIWSVALRFNLPLVPHFLSLSILNQIDKIMIEGLCAPGKAAIYSVAHTIAAMIQLLMTAINYSLVPWTYQKLKDGECAEVARKTNLILLAVAAVLCILMLLAPEVMWVMAPAEYQEAIYVIPSMSAGIFFNYLYQLYSRVELYHEKTKLMMYGSISCAVLNLFLNYAFIKAYGYMAAAYTTLFCYIYMSIIHGVMAHKITQEHQYTVRPYNTRGILSISGVVMLVSLGIPFLYRYTYVRLGMILAVAIAMALNGKKVVRLTQYILNK